MKTDLTPVAPLMAADFQDLMPLASDLARLLIQADITVYDFGAYVSDLAVIELEGDDVPEVVEGFKSFGRHGDQELKWGAWLEKRTAIEGGYRCCYHVERLD